MYCSQLTSFDKAATGTGGYVALIARRIGNSDYRVKLKKVASGAITIYAEKVVSGQETALATRTVSGLVAGPTEALRLRFSVTGSGTTTLNAKVWKTTATEPAAWQVTATDTTSQLQAPGGIGIWTYLSGSATNAPVTTLVDNLAATQVVP